MDAQAQTERKSIIGSKYAGKYKEKDWLGTFIDANATDVVTREKKNIVKDEATGVETISVETIETKKRSLNLDNLFALSKANAIDTTDMEAQRDRPNAPGRIRMTLGNSLRAAAKHRHGLFNLAGEWVEAPAEWLGEAVKTQNPDGSKIVVAKVDAGTEAATEAAEI